MVPHLSYYYIGIKKYGNFPPKNEIKLKIKCNIVYLSRFNKTPAGILMSFSTYTTLWVDSADNKPILFPRK